jgi:ribosomal protein S12 methylthiotransferase accessory factor
VFRTSSNGLCGGNTVTEALLHGLCEVIERDSCLRSDQARFEPERTVILDTVSARPGRLLLERFTRAGMELQVVDMSGPTGLPCFEAWLDHPEGPALTRGSGCHPNRSTALVRALTEAAQSRLTYIAGSRDDIPRPVYRTRPSGRRQAEGRPARFPGERRYDAAPAVPLSPFRAQLREVVGRVRRLTGMSPMAVDLGRPDFGVPVLFVVAPGLGTRRSI